jgi:predicted SnoaL-like aldol condensation-catalyzing enzyme
MKTLTAVSLACLLGCSAGAHAAPADQPAALSDSVSEHNKAVAIAFWNALNTQGWDAASQYLSSSYHEHSGSSPSGLAEWKAYYGDLKTRQPRHYSAIMRAFAEGDLVFLHVHDFPAPGQFGAAMMVYFRFEDGKIAEQWTAKQDVPGIRNFNGMF